MVLFQSGHQSQASYWHLDLGYQLTIAYTFKVVSDSFVANLQ